MNVQGDAGLAGNVCGYFGFSSSGGISISTSLTTASNTLIEHFW